MIVELKPMERAQSIDETIECAASNVFDAPARTADGVVVMAAIAEHKGCLAAVVQPQGGLTFRGEPLERPINGRARNGGACFLEARTELGRREETGLGP